jgi:hypothetical protein
MARLYKAQEGATTGASYLLDGRDEYGFDVAEMSDEERAQYEKLRESWRARGLTRGRIVDYMRGFNNVPVLPPGLTYEQEQRWLDAVARESAAWEREAEAVYGPSLSDFIATYYREDPTAWALPSVSWDRIAINFMATRDQRMLELARTQGTQVPSDTQHTVYMPWDPTAQGVAQMMAAAGLVVSLGELLNNALSEDNAASAWAVSDSKENARQVFGDPSRNPLVACTAYALTDADLNIPPREVNSFVAEGLPDFFVERVGKIAVNEQSDYSVATYRLKPEASACLDALLASDNPAQSYAFFVRALDKMAPSTKGNLNSADYFSLVAGFFGLTARAYSASESQKKVAREIQTRETALMSKDRPVVPSNPNQAARVYGEIQMAQVKDPALRARLYRRAWEAASKSEDGNDRFFGIQRLALSEWGGIPVAEVDKMSQVEVIQRLRALTPPE